MQPAAHDCVELVSPPAGQKLIVRGRFSEGIGGREPDDLLVEQCVRMDVASDDTSMTAL
jgi:hypothetical protein